MRLLSYGLDRGDHGFDLHFRLSSWSAFTLCVISMHKIVLSFILGATPWLLLSSLCPFCHACRFIYHTSFGPVYIETLSMNLEVTSIIPSHVKIVKLNKYEDKVSSYFIQSRNFGILNKKKWF